MKEKESEDISSEIQKKTGQKRGPGSPDAPQSDSRKPDPASGGDPMGDSGGTCRCTVCGNSEPKGDVPCNQLRCPECGGAMAGE
jgi:hypothetical protein